MSQKIVNVHYKIWAKRYNLKITGRACLNCGKILYPTIPWKDGKIVGLSTESHGCPDGYNHQIFRSLNPKDIKIFKDLFKNIQELNKNES